MKLISFNASNNKHFYDSLALKENPFYDNPICEGSASFGERERENLHALCHHPRRRNLKERKKKTLLSIKINGERTASTDEAEFDRIIT
jgi:hypothetical protein